ncbi:beta-ketoacyl synthase domain-containing protein [Phlyctema vagabunda]|uniref:Beta-ketoacyl synthase domain-containing protein n=1 Tax=Phlyctema vagabunda TaxID=108571 RepID=A0ABR4PS87_9HELO
MSTRTSQDDIAIIGMSCRVAGAQSPSQLWDVLSTSQDLRKKITRFNMDAFYHREGGPRKGMTNVRNAYMLEDDTIDRFDHAFFHTTPIEAASIDPQQRMLLEIAYEAMENAGLVLEDFQGTDTAVFAGMFTHNPFSTRDIEATPRYMATGTATCMAANRISYFFNLSGASMTVNTACSSTMAALHQAVRTLQRGDASMALVCGAKLILTPDMFIPSSELGFLSPTGTCHSFDAKGDGYARGEGVLALLIKPLEDAIRCGDPVRAVLKAVALNQDGRTQGITLPSANAQRENMIKLYHDNNIAPASIQYLEAHGTGTSAGDPLEFEAINSVFSRTRYGNPLVVGSIKSSIGHLEACAALAGIIKTVLCLERNRIPPQINFNAPNPKINFQAVTIPDVVVDWPAATSGVRRAAINTFGAGGTNGHAVLEEYINSSPITKVEDGVFLFKVSAADSDSLRRLSLQYAEYTEHHQPSIQDLAHTLLARRSLLRHSYFFTAQSLREVIAKLRDDSNTPYITGGEKIQEIVFVFAGQGAQWPQMGKELLEHSEIFRATISECEQALLSLADAPEWSLTAELLRPPSSTNVYHANISQPICTAVQIGLVNVWRSWGLQPSNVVGHSSGEIGAAYTVGFISLRDAIIVAYYRGLYVANMDENRDSESSTGLMSMCAIGTSENLVSQYLEMFPDLDLAAVNSPESCTLSGGKESIRALVQVATSDGIFCRELKVDIAYHSRFMLSIADRYEEALVEARVTFKNSQSPSTMISSVTCEVLRAEDCTPKYWKENMVSTVQFYLALKKSLSSFSETVATIELGPHPALLSPMKETFRFLEKDIVRTFHSFYRNRNAVETMLLNAGAMMAARIKLDTYALNGRVDSNGIKIYVPWLSGLKETNPDTNMPITVFLLMAIEAARQLQISLELNSKFCQLSEVIFEEDLPLSLFSRPDTVIELHFSAKKNKGETYTFTISSLPTDEARPEMNHASGIISWEDRVKRVSDLHGFRIQHDPMLLDRYRELKPGFDEKLKSVRTSGSSFTGAFKTTDAAPSTSVQFLTLDALLTLPVLPSLVSRLPWKSRVLSIGLMTIPTQIIAFDDPTFAVRAALSGRFELEINRGSKCLHILDLSLQDLGTYHPQREFGSLLYRPSMLPDISLLPFTETPINLQALLSMVTHKWPMCDLGVCQLGQEKTNRILECLRKWERKRYRSIQVTFEQTLRLEKDVRFSDTFDTDTRLHMLFAAESTRSEHITEFIGPHGILCLERITEAAEVDLTKSFEMIGFVQFMDGSDPWSLWRRRASPKLAPLRNVRIFSSGLLTDLIDDLPAKLVELEHNSISRFCTLETESYDAIIMESDIKSIISTWPGDQLIPWLQHLLRFSKRIIWVTQKQQESPFASLAGIVLRTLQSEKPSLKVTWLKFQLPDQVNLIKETVLRILSADLDDNEIQYNMVDSKFQIMRYLPDDELSALTGLTGPVSTSVDSGNYELMIKYPNKPVIAVSNSCPPISPLPEYLVTVEVIASVVDEQDIQAHNTYAAGLSGRFFGGEVISTSAEWFKPGQFVIGWQKSRCKSKFTTVPHGNLFECYDSESVVKSTTYFAAMCAALAIVDGNARARTGDTFRLDLSGILKEAVENFATDCGALVLRKDEAATADFDVTIHPKYGITINQSRVNVEDYLSTAHGAYIIERVWAGGLQFSSPITITNLSNVEEAFLDGTPEAAYSNIIVHHCLTKAKDILATYQPTSNLLGNGAYIVIGGLGGLGRYVLTWMAQNGAKNLFVISRGGLKTDNAQETFDHLKASGVSLTVLKADACDHNAMEKILRTVRQQHSIKGVLNLAVLLGDAPLASMTGAEWDRALQLKIRSSWILHEKTLDDELEFFIMFSSIASVLGNRNQAGYNVGNGFLNSLTQFRRSIGLCGVSIGLGAMTDIGILYDLKKGEAMLQTLTRSGLTHLQRHHLGKIMEAAVNESYNLKSDRPFILTGLEMFERVDGKLVGSQDQTMLYWTELPEFGFLQSHRKTWDSDRNTDTQYMDLKEGVNKADESEARALLLDAFMGFLAQLLGYQVTTLDAKNPLVAYGIDSLTGVSCQYWFHRELDVDVKVPDILGAKSFENLVDKVYKKIKDSRTA